LKNLAERRLGKSVKNAVISVPASFGELERKAIKKAAAMSELKVIHLLNEPTAAALWYFRGQESDSIVVVVHLGGGTFDVSVVWFRLKQFEVLGSDGNSTFGGNDFDYRIVDHLHRLFQKQTGKDARGDLKAEWKLKEASERAKRHLSTSNETKIEIDDLFDGESLSVILTRSLFESLISDLLEGIMDVLRRVLLLCGQADTRTIDHVLFSGGSTRIPKLQRMMGDLFYSNYTQLSIIADDSIALIAATEGAYLSGDRLAEAQIHTNENSAALQIEGMFPGCWAQGVSRSGLKFLLHPWLPLPWTSVANHTWTAYPGCSVVNFGVYRGWYDEPYGNLYLGRVSLDELRTDGEGAQVRVGVHFNENNEINVTAEDLRTGRKSWAIFKVYSEWKYCRCPTREKACPSELNAGPEDCIERSRRE
jgi:molecular chaperone DnaK (HSP70)